MRHSATVGAMLGLMTLTACGGGSSGVAVPQTNKTGAFAATDATNGGTGSITVTIPAQTGAVKYRVYLGQDSNVSTTVSEQSRLFDASGNVSSLSALAGSNPATSNGADTETTTPEPGASVALSIDGLTPGVVYYFVVQVLDANGDQLSSSTVGAAMQEVAISNVAYDETAGGYTVEWTKLGGVLDGYYVQWTTSSGDYSAGNASALTSEGGATIPGLDASTEYFFRVIAIAKDVPTSSIYAKAGSERSSAGGSCGSNHNWTGKTAIFSYASCDSVDGVTVWNNTANEAGETLGTRSPAYGKLSFTITGTTNYEIGTGDAMLIFVNAMNNGREVNWHFQYYNLGPVVEHRLTTQRFDGTCSPFCEQKSISRTLQFPNSSTDRSTSYHFDCMWESGNDAFTYASCDVSDPTTGALIYQTGQVDTQGNYAELSYVGVGHGGYHNAGPYGWPAGGKVSDFQLTFFQ